MYPLIRLTNSLELPTYFVIISATYVLATIWLVRRTERAHLSRQVALDLALAIMIGGFIGSRVFHIVFEQPSLYWQNPQMILEFWHGGFVFYGGAVGAALATAMVFFKKRMAPWIWFDIFAPLFPFGYGLGRLGCFLAGCCFGRDCPYPWAVRFPPGVEAPAHVAIHPTQLYAAAWELTVLGLLLLLERTVRGHAQNLPPKVLPFVRPGYLLFSWGILHSLGRIGMESFRADFRGHFFFGFSPATWMSIGILLGCLCTVFYRSRGREQS